MINTLINWMEDRWYSITTFFPVQLFLLHLRRSLLLIIFWLLLAAFIGGFLAENYGLRYLFLTPEYLDRVNFLSYFLVGGAFGLFVMAFHINSYIYYSYRYTFLATLSRPLWKFSVNNSIIPLLFVLFYICNILDLLLDEGYGIKDILINLLGLISGSILTISFSFSYFIWTLKTLEIPEEKSKSSRALEPLKKLMQPQKELKEVHKPHINYYMRSPFSIKLARDAGHYDKKVLLQTIQQHHFSASIYFVILILIVIALGLVGYNRVLMIPAGATIFLIFSLYLMITGVFYTHLKTWTVTVGILILLILNYFSGFERFATLNHAYGMDYQGPRASYTYTNLDSLTTDSLVRDDREQTLQVLENWRKKQDVEKPRMIILNVSGGGQRSALWVMKVLQEIDAATQGSFYKQIHLITGSSGGMLGAAFYREMKYRYKYGLINVHPGSDTLLTLMGKDLLNPVCYTFAVNDLFFRSRNATYGQYSYPIDRGYSFDQRLNEMSMGVLNRRFKEYKKLELSSEMPMMILAPTIVGDGRKLLMSPLGISYLTFTNPYIGIGHDKEYNGVEFSRMFKEQDAGNLSFLTALRMSASFPYITPLISMPSDPYIELIDAGVRDNEGFELCLRYVFANQEWIRENTAGVLVVQIKANRVNEVPIKDERITKFDKLILPIGGVLQSFHNLQIYNKSLFMELSRDELEMPMEIIRFSLINDKEDVSLSWHLTNEEKSSIISTFKNEINQSSLDSLLMELKEK